MVAMPMLHRSCFGLGSNTIAVIAKAIVLGVTLWFCGAKTILGIKLRFHIAVVVYRVVASFIAVNVR